MTLSSGGSTISTVLVPDRSCWIPGPRWNTRLARVHPAVWRCRCPPASDRALLHRRIACCRRVMRIPGPSGQFSGCSVVHRPLVINQIGENGAADSSGCDHCPIGVSRSIAIRSWSSESCRASMIDQGSGTLVWTPEQRDAERPGVAPRRDVETDPFEDRSDRVERFELDRGQRRSGPVVRPHWRGPR